MNNRTKSKRRWWVGGTKGQAPGAGFPTRRGLHDWEMGGDDKPVCRRVHVEISELLINLSQDGASWDFQGSLQGAPRLQGGMKARVGWGDRGGLSPH